MKTDQQSPEAKSAAGRVRGDTRDPPEWIKPPQLTKLVDAPPAGPDWLLEIKFDGYRMHARLDHGSVRLLTRNGLDCTHKHPAIESAVSKLPAGRAYFAENCAGSALTARPHLA